MPFLAAATIAMIAKGVLTAVLGPFVEEAREATVSAAQDKIRSKITGRLPIEEWAGIVVEGVDKVKERILDEGDLRFIGGKLKFAMPTNDLKTVNISFQLYFQDEFEKWHKAEADSDVPASKFELGDLDEISSKGEIVFDVE